MECPTGVKLKLDDLGLLSGVIVCEDSSPNLYSFSGYIEVEDNRTKLKVNETCQYGLENKGYENSEDFLELDSLSVARSEQEAVPREVKRKAPLAAENVLLRGSRLKTTSYVYGL